jgi:hypothetical protein
MPRADSPGQSRPRHGRPGAPTGIHVYRRESTSSPAHAPRESHATPSPQPGGWLLEGLDALVPRLPRVRHLDLALLVEWDALDAAARRALRAGFPALARLSLRFCRFGTPRAMVRLVRAFPRLRALDVEYAQWARGAFAVPIVDGVEDEEEEEGKAEELLRLTALSVDLLQSAEVAAWLARIGAAATVRSLAITSSLPHEHECPGRSVMLDTVGRQLRHLRVVVSNAQPGAEKLFGERGFPERQRPAFFDVLCVPAGSRRTEIACVRQFDALVCERAPPQLDARTAGAHQRAGYAGPEAG